MRLIHRRLNKQIIVIIGALMLFGAVIRLVNCYWGYPHALHPDEHTIVESAIDMIRRSSWEANVYNRPDHFEIKGCAILFQVVSFIRYRVSADVAFAEHKMAFYLIARGFTTVFGVLMIPLGYMLLERLKKGSGLIGAVLITCYPAFIEHSAYATPDVVLTFMVMLIAYTSILFLEKPTTGKIAAMSVFIGLGITIKYTCAICCLWIAIIICYQSIRNKKYGNILTYGSMAMLIILATSFFMAPNLFTNLSQTISTLQQEARTNHPGADGLGFIGNFWYYLTTFFSKMGWEAFPFMLIGIFNALWSKHKRYISLLLGLLFWVMTSALALHWERWGMPIYIFMVFTIALGMRMAVDSIDKAQSIVQANHVFKKILSITLALWIGVICTNIFLSGISDTANKLLKDTRIAALTFCNQNGISEDITVYDGYTPFLLQRFGVVPLARNENGNLTVTNEKQDASYIILSSFMYDRYYAEAKRYTSRVALYDAIRLQCELVKAFSPSVPVKSSWAVINIGNRIRDLFNYNPEALSGPTILILRIPKS